MRDLSFQFHRLNSTGNTFILCDLDTQPFSKEDRPGVARRLCSQFVGFRSDGFIFLKQLSESQFEWDFYNADGSQAEMCGNATRAVACYLQIQKPVNLKTQIGEVTLASKDLKKGIFSSQWSIQSETHWEQEIEFQGHFVTYDFCDTGVPHGIVEMDPYIELARKLRHLKAHNSNGMNVTFVESQSPGEVIAVTYERGVEDFTLSCGTGAVAAAIWSKELNPELKSHQIQMPGGALLVTFKEDSLIELSGLSKLDFKFEVNL